MTKSKRVDCQHCGKDYATSYIQRHIKKAHPDEYEPKKDGAPSYYKPKYVDKVDEYIEKCIDSFEKQVKYETDQSTGYSYIPKVELPMVEGFAQYIGVHKSTLYSWAEKHDEFDDALTRIKDIQKLRLVNNGLGGRYDARIVKMLLSANHDMKEKKSHEHSGSFSLTKLAQNAEEDE